MKNMNMKICICGPPFYYAPFLPNGNCRFCWGYKLKILTLKQLQLREIGHKY